MTKKFLRIFLLTAFLVAAAQISASAEEWRDCIISNETGKTITAVYFRPATADDWGQNFIVEGTLPSGYYIDAQYVPRADYILKIVFEDNSSAEWTGENKFHLEDAKIIEIYKTANDTYSLAFG